MIQIEGHVDAARAPDAIALVRDRLGALRTLDDATASRFVVARRRVISRLRSLTTGSRALADLAEASAALGRDIATDDETADAATRLTIDQLDTTALDLGRAPILLRGPRGALERTYASLGRKPQIIELK